MSTLPDPAASPTASTAAASAAFEQAKACFLDGLAQLEAGQLEAAEAQFSASLQHLPGRVSTLVNLAATQVRRGRFEAALATTDELLRHEPDNADGWLHRATALGSLQRLEEAVAGFERALARHDQEPETWLRHAQALHALDRRDAALRSYEKALALQPAMPGAWSRYGDILREQGRLAEAARAFQQALDHGGDVELNRYYLASVQPGAAPGRPPRPYVQALFDSYAEDFEQHLVGQLGYQAHTRLIEGLHALRAEPSLIDSAIDLGCGTGLCGPGLRPLARQLVGVDLSQGMLDRARQRQCYDRLVCADVVEHLQTTAERHDLVVAADVLIYIGELDALFAAAHRAMKPGAIFCFTVEQPSRPELELELELELTPSLRYAHSQAGVRRAAAAQGFTVLKVIAQPLRQDQRVPIDGLYVYLQRAIDA